MQESGNRLVLVATVLHDDGRYGQEVGDVGDLGLRRPLTIVAVHQDRRLSSLRVRLATTLNVVQHASLLLAFFHAVLFVFPLRFSTA